MKAKTIQTARISRDASGRPYVYLHKAASEFLFNHRADGGCSMIIVKAYRFRDGKNEVVFSCKGHDFSKTTSAEVVSANFETEQGPINARFDGRLLSVSRPVEWVK